MLACADYFQRDLQKYIKMSRYKHFVPFSWHHLSNLNCKNNDLHQLESFIVHRREFINANHTFRCTNFANG